MTITQILPDDIIKILSSRLKSSFTLWKRWKESDKDSSDTEQEQVLFFKYYFDFSTAIEHCIRGILFEYKNHSSIGSIIDTYIEPDSDKKSFLPTKDVLRGIITDANFNKINSSNNLDIQEINEFLPLSLNHLTTTNVNYDFFLEKYKAIRDTRNKLAHGIEATQNVNFTNEHLRDYLYVFYIIFSVYTDTWTCYSNSQTQ